MARDDRMMQLLVNPSRLIDSEAFLAMDPFGQRAFLVLWLSLYYAEEVGVVRAEPRILAARARVEFEEWEHYHEQVGRGFDTTSRPGYWLAPDMISSHAEQMEWRAQKRKAGGLGGKAQRRKGLERRSSDAGSDAQASRVKSKDSVLLPSLGLGTSAQVVPGVAERSVVPRAGLSGDVVILLPCTTDVDFPIYDIDVREFTALYPAVNIEQQLRAMRGWLYSHPERRKTPRGVLGFVNTWLGREQNRDAPVARSARRGADQRYAASNMKIVTGGSEYE